MVGDADHIFPLRFREHIVQEERCKLSDVGNIDGLWSATTWDENIRQTSFTELKCVAESSAVVDELPIWECNIDLVHEHTISSL